MTSLGLRHRLRAATSDAHSRLDAHLTGFDLQSLAGYRRFIEVSAAALVPLEDALVRSGVERLFPDWSARSRQAAILHDLANLRGMLDPLSTPGSLNFGAVLGAMYVLEGSRLGAAYLVKTVEQSPDPLVARTTAYLRHGEGQKLWPSFLEALERLSAQLDDTTSAEAGARQAFAMFERAAAQMAAPVSVAPTRSAVLELA